MNKPRNKLEELLDSLHAHITQNKDSKTIATNLKKLIVNLLSENLNSLMLISHNRKGDNAEFLIKKDKYYTKYIDELLTIYYSEKTDEYVGGLIKGISKYLEELDRQNIKGFLVEIDNGSGIQGHVFLVDKQKNYKYEELQKHIYKI